MADVTFVPGMLVRVVDRVSIDEETWSHGTSSVLTNHAFFSYATLDAPRLFWPTFGSTGLVVDGPPQHHTHVWVSLAGYHRVAAPVTRLELVGDVGE